MKKITFTLILLTSIFMVSINADEISPLLPHDKGKKFIYADIVVIGTIKFIKQINTVIQDSILLDGWQKEHTSNYDVCSFRIDSILKGKIIDTLIVFESKHYGFSDVETKFSHINENGDSSFVANASLGYGPSSSGFVLNKKYILFFSEIESKYFLILKEEYSDDNLKFFLDVKKNGIEHLLPKPTKN